MTEKILEAKQLIAEYLSENRPTCVTSSFQTECVAVVHLIIERAPEIPVLLLDTGYHFKETYAYRDEISRRFHLNLQNLQPRITVAEQEEKFGILNQTAPDRCCKIRKVEPLFASLENYEIWFTGLRRDQSPTRAHLEAVEDFKLPGGKQLKKISPLAMWSTKDVWDYLKANEIPVLPLYDLGYTSIGCEPCTALPFDPENPRSGRWGGHKLECGIHIQADS
ncbi:MAG: phosphoadenylyl-sulfate reductase [Bryobacteraceae bacterium]